MFRATVQKYFILVVVCDRSHQCAARVARRYAHIVARYTSYTRRRVLPVQSISFILCFILFLIFKLRYSCKLSKVYFYKNIHDSFETVKYLF